MNILSEVSTLKALKAIEEQNTHMKTYFKQWDLSNWNDVFELGRSGLANKVLKVGDEIAGTYTIDGTVYDYPWIVMDFRDVTALVDGQEKVFYNAPIVQAKYTTHEGVEFDAPEKYPAKETVAQEGWHYVALDGTDYTLLSISTGDPIPYSEHDTVYKTEWNDVAPVQYGENCWARSFVRQYMNNNGSDWIQPTHETDVPPESSENMTNMLSYFPTDMIEALHPIKIETKRSDYMDSGVDFTYDKFWLPSLSEMNFYSDYTAASDGDPWAYYKNASGSETPISIGTKRYGYINRYIVNEKTTSQNWWTRSACLNNYHEQFVYINGLIASSTPGNKLCLLPCCALV